MKKYGFLVPVAIAASALGLAPSEFTAGEKPLPIPKAGANLDVQDRGRMIVSMTKDRVDSFVLKRADADGTLVAQHDSHESHQSHASHESHESHASHDSHASHQSST
jgi:hypothetical protein